MLTVGGMVTTEREDSSVKASALTSAIYYRKSFSDPPYLIKVPNVTRKERLYLDSAMPCAIGWAPKDFELDPDDVSHYREIYRFFPPYAELLL